MFQREFALRLVARPGDNLWNRYVPIRYKEGYEEYHKIDAHVLH